MKIMAGYFAAVLVLSVKVPKPQNPRLFIQGPKP